MKVDILELRPDGWCLVRKPKGTKEYWLPGNYLTTDGKSTRMVETIFEPALDPGLALFLYPRPLLTLCNFQG